jgi:ABC-type glycerol-3-phosphate transport system substrate-binding protein
MEKFLKELRDRPISIVIFVFIFIVFISFLIDRIFLAPKRKKSELPCYNKEIVIWTEFRGKPYETLNKSLKKYCLKVKVVFKRNKEIESQLLQAIAEGNSPDIVYISNNYLEKNKKIFKEYDGKKLKLDNYPESLVKIFNNKFLAYPFAFDVLINFVNKDYLANAGLYESIYYWEDLDNYFSSLRVFDQNGLIKVSPISLGLSNNVENYTEIFLTINKNLNQENYKKANSIIKTLDFITKYSDKSSSYYGWDTYFPNSIEAFAQEKLVFLPAFYSQKKEILEANPRINFTVSPFFQFKNVPKKYNYLKSYYLAVLKNKNSKISWLVIEELDRLYPKFVESFEILPSRKDLFENVDKEKEIIIKQMLSGDYFEDVNYDFVKDVLKDYLNRWLIDRKNIEEKLKISDIFKFFNK